VLLLLDGGQFTEHLGVLLLQPGYDGTLVEGLLTLLLLDTEQFGGRLELEGFRFIF